MNLPKKSFSKDLKNPFSFLLTTSKKGIRDPSYAFKDTIRIKEPKWPTHFLISSTFISSTSVKYSKDNISTLNQMLLSLKKLLNKSIKLISYTEELSSQAFLIMPLKLMHFKRLASSLKDIFFFITMNLKLDQAISRTVVRRTQNFWWIETFLNLKS